MGVEATIESSTTRLAKLKGILSKPPAGFVKLEGYVKADKPIPLGEWPAQQVVPGLADELDALCLETFEDSEAADMKFSWCFIGADGRTLRVRETNLRRRGEALDASGIVSQLDGSDRASTMLAQQVALAMARMFMSGQQAVTQSLIDLNRANVQDRLNSDARASEAHEAYAEIREMMIELREQQGVSAPAPPENMSAAQEQFWRVASQYLPVLVGRFLQAENPKKD